MLVYTVWLENIDVSRNMGNIYRAVGKKLTILEITNCATSDAL